MPAKKQRKNKGRRDPTLARIVQAVTRDSLLTLDELTGNKGEAEIKRDEKDRVITETRDLPSDTTVVDTMNGSYAYKDERMMKHIPVMEKIMQEFEDSFWKDEGHSVRFLRRDKKGRAWADDQTILNFCYTAVAMNLAIWPYKRKEWAALTDGLPFIKFICDKKHNTVEGAHHEDDGKH